MNNLKKLRQSIDLSQNELAKIFNVSEKTILRWEKGLTDIKSTKAEQLAKYFEVSVPYLLGFSNYKNKFEVEIDNENGILDNKFLERIIEVVGEESIPIIEKNYIEDSNSPEPDYSELASLRNAVVSLQNTDEEKLLLHFAILSESDKSLVLDLIGRLSNTR